MLLLHEDLFQVCRFQTNMSTSQSWKAVRHSLNYITYDLSLPGCWYIHYMTYQLFDIWIWGSADECNPNNQCSIIPVQLSSLHWLRWYTYDIGFNTFRILINFNKLLIETFLNNYYQRTKRSVLTECFVCNSLGYQYVGSWV